MEQRHRVVGHVLGAETSRTVCRGGGESARRAHRGLGAPRGSGCELHGQNRLRIGRRRGLRRSGVVESVHCLCVLLGVDIDDLDPGQRRGVDESPSHGIDDEDLAVRGQHIVDEFLTASGRIHTHQRRAGQRASAPPEQELGPILKEDPQMRRLGGVEVLGQEMAATNRCPGEVVPCVVVVLEADADVVIAEAGDHQSRRRRRQGVSCFEVLVLTRRGHDHSSRAWATMSLPSSSRRASAAPRTIPISRTRTKNRWMWLSRSAPIPPCRC